MKVWGVWAELNELVSGNHWSDWQTEWNTAQFNRDLGGKDVYNPDTERSIDVEETYCVMQMLKRSEVQSEGKLSEKKEDEEVDLV